MRIGVTNVQVPFVKGGAEVHADNLVSQLQARGFEAELITIPFKWYPPERLLESIAIARMLDLSESNGMRIDRLIGLKFPIYLAPHPDKVLWILHQYRSAYDLWDHPEHGDLINLPQGQAVRAAVHHADKRFLPEATAIYANSRNVADRLKRYNGIAATPLYHPPSGAERFRSAPALDYFFFPSRITPLKRQNLVIEALARCREPVRVVFAGTAEVLSYMAELLERCREVGLGDRAVFKGFTSDAEKLDLYAESLGIIYPPVDEDYGYVTLEAMLSRKPVITTNDSGGPLEFVEHERTGLICAPDATQLAARMDELWRDRSIASRMGEAGRGYYDALGISWDNVVEVLTA
ncbi:putative glycosyl transferase [Novosphingobium sp. Rr 2-17]|uniref:glycosyltransferase family 4 protein n=1 Tax=Novosphingobium sp. Rr 2-17 TaxID=555793 RepID=UPI000269ABDB|nr:glycosyltransferase family 4 protein [Novosphingobium sp. Rr 2-17]EIZ77172.1 putative glycosyl transferase [Novosphingobium sp. Rr 2-17]